MAVKDEVGRRGEDLAAWWLADQGWQVLDRNWRCRDGEVDLVALDGDELVIVEVKTRSSLAVGHPAEAVTPAKLARLRRLTGAWLAAHPRVVAGVRIDVLSLLLPPGRSPMVSHLRGVA